MVARVAIQQHLRLYRDGLRSILEGDSEIEVVGVAHSADDLLDLCFVTKPDVVVLDAIVDGWDVDRLVSTLRATFDIATIIGLIPSIPRASDLARARRCGMNTLLARGDGVSEIFKAIRHRDRPLQPVRIEPAERKISGGRHVSSLTDRELTVLNLVGAGCTSKEISHRLTISHKTVENHKQRIFRKLGVQNQAHAVSIAMRSGMLHPAETIELAASD